VWLVGSVLDLGELFPPLRREFITKFDCFVTCSVYPHGPYAMGALDYLSDVIVYYINVSTN
jgi:hypothetical protein